MTRRTKIVCTIGPASDSEEMIAKLVDTGMNVARLNFSHGTSEYLRDLVQKIKRVRKSMNRPVAILQDLQGPKIRIGVIGGNVVQLHRGNEFILTTDDVSGDANRASVSLKTLPKEVKAGHRILLADGNIELVAENVTPTEIRCRVVVGGPLSSHKGINLPASRLHVDSLTEKDREDIVIGLAVGVDSIALSFVRKASDIQACRKVVKEHGGSVPIIAKIEKHEAVQHIDSIIAVSEGIMVARGDLGVEIDLERVPLVQKAIIHKCNALGKPVITATQMLLHMVDNPRPTRAEATDVANAILDGTDAIMLSEETAAGKTPQQLGHDIETRLKKFVADPNVTVIVSSFVGAYSEQIRIVGEAVTPKSIPYQAHMTALDAMIAAGGLTPYAAGNRAKIVRHVDGKEVSLVVRLSDLLKNGDLGANTDLRPGDIIIIPQSFF